MVKLKLNEEGQGAFYAMDGEQQLGEMVVSISGNELTAHHTEVAPEAEGKGIAKKLLQELADFARKNEMKVIPLCSYVYVQFKKHPEEYADIWNKGD